MHGEASRIADRTSRDTLAPELQGCGSVAWRIGNELFVITDALDSNKHLERALTDPARTVEEKYAVVEQLIGSQAHPITMRIMRDLIGRKFSRVRDIANAVEDFGVDAMMYYADSTDDTLAVTVELAQLQSALLNLPVVRSKLYDETVSPRARVELLDTLLEGNHFHQVTICLAEHATRSLRKRRYLSTIQWLIHKFSRHMGESMVTVTTAVPLQSEQLERLDALYTAKLGRKVHINCVIDPMVIGGMRIQVGDEVIDNTVVAQLHQLRRAVRATA